MGMGGVGVWGGPCGANPAPRWMRPPRAAQTGAEPHQGGHAMALHHPSWESTLLVLQHLL